MLFLEKNFQNFKLLSVGIKSWLSASHTASQKIHARDPLSFNTELIYPERPRRRANQFDLQLTKESKFYQ
jgi:hypothetical protein